MIPPDQDFAARVRSSFDRQRAMALLGAQMTEVQPGMTEIVLPFREALTNFLQSRGFRAGRIGRDLGDIGVTVSTFAPDWVQPTWAAYVA